MRFSAIIIYCLVELSILTCATAQAKQWQLSAPLRGSGQDFLDSASDGSKLRLIDGVSVYSANLSGGDPRLIASFDKLVDIAYSNGLWIIAAQNRISRRDRRSPK